MSNLTKVWFAPLALLRLLTDHGARGGLSQITRRVPPCQRASSTRHSREVAGWVDQRHAVRRGIQSGGRGAGDAGVLALRVAAEGGGDCGSRDRPGPDPHDLPAVQTRNQ